MTIPAFRWHGLQAVEVVSGTLFPASALTAIRNDALHLREIVMDPERHTAAVSHSHDGVDSDLIPFASPNLVASACLNSSTAGSGSSEWTHSKSLTFGAYNTDPGAQFQEAGQYAMTELGAGDSSDVDDLPSERCFGNGADLVVSCYAKTTATATTGWQLFGISQDSNAEFAPLCTGAIHCTDLTTSWKRFWFRCSVPKVERKLMFLSLCDERFTSPIRFDCPQVTLGTGLSWWEMMPNDVKHFNWQYVSNLPFLDQAVSFTNAVRLPAE